MDYVLAECLCCQPMLRCCHVHSIIIALKSSLGTSNPIRSAQARLPVVRFEVPVVCMRLACIGCKRAACGLQSYRDNYYDCKHACQYYTINIAIDTLSHNQPIRIGLTLGLLLSTGGVSPVSGSTSISTWGAGAAILSRISFPGCRSLTNSTLEKTLCAPLALWTATRSEMKPPQSLRELVELRRRCSSGARFFIVRSGRGAKLPFSDNKLKFVTSWGSI